MMPGFYCQYYEGGDFFPGSGQVVGTGESPRQYSCLHLCTIWSPESAQRRYLGFYARVRKKLTSSRTLALLIRV